MLDNETKQRINSARQILVGKVPDPKAQVEQITTALIYKFMDDMDRENEDLGGKASFFTGALKKFSWGKMMSRANSGEQRWDLYTRALVEFSKAKHVPELFRTIFKGAFLPYRDPETLNLFLKEIAGFSYGNSENLGNAFEYLLSILGSQGDAGQFRTPRHIIDFIVEVVNPGKSDKILDPACGTAGFLISAYKHIQRINASNYDEKKYKPVFTIKDPEAVYGETPKVSGLSPDDRKKLTGNVVGYDISPDMVRLSLVNMYLHGFPTPEIFEYDTLTYEDRWGDNFDVILANPPFMTPKGGIRPHSRFQVKAKRAEVLFVDYIAEHLTINGKAGIIVPEGIIFQSSNAYKALRKMLVEDNYLWAVVSLPAGVFQPYSGVKTSILFLDKQAAKKSDEIIFVKVENDGFDLGAQRRQIDKNDLPEAYNILKNFLKGGEFVELKQNRLVNRVKKKEIAENGEYNLTGDRYREAVDYSRVKWPMVKLGDVCEFIRGPFGGSLKKEIFKKDGFLVYEQYHAINNDFSFGRYFIDKNKFDEMKRFEVKSGDLLMSCSGTMGKIAIVPDNFKKGIVNQALLKLTPKDNINNIYLKMLLISDAVQSNSIQNEAGAGIKNVASVKILKKIQIPIPPLEVQREIVAELESYQKVIDGARQVVENWKPRIKIDPDWEMVKLGDVCEKIMDGTHFSPNNSVVGEKLYITAKNIKEAGIDLSNITYISQKDHQKIYKRCPLIFGDVLYIKDGATAGIATINTIKEDFSLLSSVAVLRGTKDKLNNLFLCFYLNSPKGKERMLSNIGGVAITRLTLTKINKATIPLPPLKTQKQIVAEIEKEQKSIEEVKKLIEIHEQKIKDRIAEVWGE